MLGLNNLTLATSLICYGLTASEAVVTNGSSQLSSLAYTPSATSSTIVSRDTHANSIANNFASGFATTASSGTVNLTAASAKIQTITVGGGQMTFVLPDATTLTSGWCFYFHNNNGGTVTIQQYGGSQLFQMPNYGSVQVYLTNNSTQAGYWDYHWLAPAATGGMFGYSLTWCCGTATSLSSSTLYFASMIGESFTTTSGIGTKFYVPASGGVMGIQGALGYTSSETTTLNFYVYINGSQQLQLPGGSVSFGSGNFIIQSATPQWTPVTTGDYIDFVVQVSQPLTNVTLTVTMILA